MKKEKIILIFSEATAIRDQSSMAYPFWKKKKN